VEIRFKEWRTPKGSMFLIYAPNDRLMILTNEEDPLLCPRSGSSARLRIRWLRFLLFLEEVEESGSDGEQDDDASKESGCMIWFF